MKLKSVISFVISCALLLQLFAAGSVYAAENNVGTINIVGGFGEFEAECEEAYVAGTYILEDNAEASGGKVILPDRMGGANLITNITAEGELYYKINVDETARYYIWLRVFAQDAGANSAFFAMDDAEFKYLGFENMGEWEWLKIYAGELTEGDHYIRFNHREVLLRYDKFIITADQSYTPVGMGENITEMEEIQYYNLPPIIPPAEHPRVMFRASDIPAIKAKLEHPENIEMYKLTQSRAAMDTDGNLPAPANGASNNLDLDVLLCAQSNAFLYQMDGDAAKAQKAITIMKNYLATVTMQAGDLALTREGGYSLYIAGQVYDWCYDLLTAEDKAHFRKYIIIHAYSMEVGWPPLKQRNLHDHACENQLFRDLLSAGIALYDEDPYIYNTVAGRLFQEIIPARNYVATSENFSQGSSYGSVRHYYEMYAEMLVRGMGYAGIWNDGMKNSMYTKLYERYPNGRFISAGDNAEESDATYNLNPMFPFFLAGNLFKNPYYRQEFYREATEGINNRANIYSITPVEHLIVNDPEVGRKSVDELPLTRYSGFPMGRMVARTGWEEGIHSNTVVAAMNFIQLYEANHQHLDSGHFDLYYKGVLALDSGIYQGLPFVRDTGEIVNSVGYACDHDGYYHKNTIAHNAMLVYNPDEDLRDVGAFARVNDGGQMGAGRKELKNYADLFDDYYKRGTVLSYNFGPDLKKPAYSYIKAEISPAYGKRLENYTRSFVFLNLEDETYPAALIVYDDITSADKTYKKTWLLHSQEEPVIDKNTVTLKRTEFGYNGRLVNETLLPADSNRSLTKIGGEGREFMVNGTNWTAIPPNDTVEAGKWRIELSPVTEAQHDRFLNVLQVGENDDSITPLKSELIENDDFVGVKIKDRVVLLNATGGATNETVEIDLAKSDEALKYVVCGLAAGEWKVYKDGAEVAAIEVEEGHDSLTFEGTSGRYTVKWNYKAVVTQKDYSITGNTTDLGKPALGVKINVRYETFKNQPYLEEGIVYLPVAEYFDKLTFDTVTSADGKNVTASHEDKTFQFQDNCNNCLINGKYLTLDAKAKKVNGVLYAPFNKLNEAIGDKVVYDVASDTLRITSDLVKVTTTNIVKSDDPARVNVVEVYAESMGDASNNIYFTVDGNNATIWSRTTEQWITYELEDEVQLDKISIFWNAAGERIQYFDILLSTDNENWTTIFEGGSDGKSKEFEDMKVPADAPKAKYVKLVGHGCNTKDIMAIKQIRFYK